jgi:hypothetical protein
MRRVWRQLAMVVLVLTMVACNGDELGPGHNRWEGIRGFAVWPEDTPEAGLEACESRIDEEPWRGAPETTADRFVRTVLDWKQPDDLSDSQVPEDAPRTMFVMGDGEMPPGALGTAVHLRQLRGCWFVVTVEPREGEVGIDYKWEGQKSDFALRVTYRRLDPVKLEVGWDDTVHRATLEKGETVVFQSPHPGRSGHILLIPVMSPSEFSFGKPLSPPPRIP